LAPFLALTVGALLLRLTLTITPSTVSFPDANPTTTPSIPGNTSVALLLRAGGGAATDPWSVKALASGDLLAGANSIAISNVTWTSAKTAGSCNNFCTCQGGTASRLAQQTMLSGQGNTSGSGVTCTQNYSLANSWFYTPGNYSQVMVITAASP
jgi:hypothetical protein